MSIRLIIILIRLQCGSLLLNHPLLSISLPLNNNPSFDNVNPSSVWFSSVEPKFDVNRSFLFNVNPSFDKADPSSILGSSVETSTVNVNPSYHKVNPSCRDDSPRRRMKK